MSFRVTVDQPNLPRGAEVSIPGLGIVKNKSKGTVFDKDAVENFRVQNGHIETVEVYETTTVGEGEDATKTEKFLGTREEWIKGPTLLQAAKTMYGVNVEEEPEDDEPEPNEEPQEDDVTPDDEDTEGSDQ